MTLEHQFLATLRDDFSAYTRKVFATVDPGATFLPGWHIDCMSEYLQACLRRDIRRLIINIPPRSMKSISVSVALPTFALGHDPAEQVLCGSYEQNLAFKHSTDSRLVMRAPWYKAVFPSAQIAPDQQEKRKFTTTRQGHRTAVTVGSNTTGLGGNLLIVDDPHNPKSAESDLERQSALDWFDKQFYNRQNDKRRAVIILVMQRLHHKDLTGHLLEVGGWEHLCLPAEAEERTVISMNGLTWIREPGELLHPTREGPEEIEELKRTMGSLAYAGQYQQRPVPQGGGILKDTWWRVWPDHKPIPPCEYIFHSWDTAFSDQALKSNAYSAMTSWGVYWEPADPTDLRMGGRYRALMLSAWRDKVDYPTLRRKAQELYLRDRPDFVLVEKKASGQSLIQDLRRAELPIHAYTPDRDKVARAYAVSAYLESGLVAAPDRKWSQDVIQECAAFPLGDYMDYVDTVTQALLLIISRSLVKHPEDLDYDETADLDEVQPRRVAAYG